MNISELDMKNYVFFILSILLTNILSIPFDDLRESYLAKKSSSSSSSLQLKKSYTKQSAASGGADEEAEGEEEKPEDEGGQGEQTPNAPTAQDTSGKGEILYTDCCESKTLPQKKEEQEKNEKAKGAALLKSGDKIPEIIISLKHDDKKMDHSTV